MLGGIRMTRRRGGNEQGEISVCKVLLTTSIRKGKNWVRTSSWLPVRESLSVNQMFSTPISTVTHPGEEAGLSQLQGQLR